MQRTIIQSLIKWKEQHTSPLLLRGARQVGKTYLVDEFGKKYFKNIVNINFELNPEYKRCFQSLEPKKINMLITSLNRQPIEAGNTLLFFDEIQQCPEAITALRYYKESMPNLHVIGAGSLLEFAIKAEEFSMPVGRVLSLYMGPLSFKEYLQANNYTNLLEYLEHLDINSQQEVVLSEALEKLLREYLLTGGMPEVVKYYIENKDLEQTQMLQLSLLNTLKNDFGKYATKIQHKYLQKLFEQTPKIIGQHFKYVNVDPNMASKDLRLALDALKDAGLIYEILNSKATGLPLGNLINPKKFKILFLDVGLVVATSNIAHEILLNNDLLLVNRGQITEQFVGQELLAYLPPYMTKQLYYWSRDKQGGMAEVDYILNKNDKIYPIEVKSGKTGTLKSLHYFINNVAKNNNIGIQYSLKPLSFDNKILSIPLYMIHQTERLVKNII